MTDTFISFHYSIKSDDISLFFGMTPRYNPCSLRDLSAVCCGIVRTRVHQLLSGPAISLHRFFDEKFLMRGECIRNVTIWANHNFYGCVIGQGFVPLNIKWQSIDLFFGQLPHSSLSFEIHVTIRTARPRALAISIMCLVPRL